MNVESITAYNCSLNVFRNAISFSKDFSARVARKIPADFGDFSKGSRGNNAPSAGRIPSQVRHSAWNQSKTIFSSIFELNKIRSAPGANGTRPRNSNPLSLRRGGEIPATKSIFKIPPPQQTAEVNRFHASILFRTYMYKTHVRHTHTRGHMYTRKEQAHLPAGGWSRPGGARPSCNVISKQAFL